MITTLRESKAKLSALVQRASKGEEIVITVRGKPTARICPISETKAPHRQAWVKRLGEARKHYSAKAKDSSQDLLDEIRGDRP
jgi:prevent-host-death family protein